MAEKLGIAGSGAIATGLAVTAAANGDVVLWARSDASVERAQGVIAKLSGKLDDAGRADRVTVTTDLTALADCTYIVEAIVEELEPKQAMLTEIASLVGEDTILASTTSSLSVAALAQASGRSDKFAALHVFNPVPQMKLIELCFMDDATEDTRTRTNALCEELGKTVVEVPDVPGFVVNALLFPYLFHAVEHSEKTGIPPEDIDTAMKLGAGHPMGPMALLDFVGLDVSAAIGDAIGATVPQKVRDLVAEGNLGRKTGRGVLDWSR
jgi:3-hydroxybutyryl-CoA dehydrogenase